MVQLFPTYEISDDPAGRRLLEMQQEGFGPTPAERITAMQSIRAQEQLARSQIAQLMGRAGGAIDPAAAARATAPLAGQTQAAIGGYEAQAAEAARAQELQVLQMISQISQQQQAQEQSTRAGYMGMAGGLLGVGIQSQMMQGQGQYTTPMMPQGMGQMGYLGGQVGQSPYQFAGGMPGPMPPMGMTPQLGIPPYGGATGGSAYLYQGPL